MYLQNGIDAIQWFILKIHEKYIIRYFKMGGQKQVQEKFVLTMDLWSEKDENENLNKDFNLRRWRIK